MTNEGLMKKKDASPPAPKPHRDRPNVLPLKGEIDLHVSPIVTASLVAMIEKKPERLVIDLSDVTYIDSAGLAALIQAMHLAAATHTPQVILFGPTNPFHWRPKESPALILQGKTSEPITEFSPVQPRLPMLLHSLAQRQPF